MIILTNKDHLEVALDAEEREKLKAELAKDLERFEAGALRLCPMGLNQHHFDAPVTFAFNLGLDLKTQTLAERLHWSIAGVSPLDSGWGSNPKRPHKTQISRGIFISIQTAVILIPLTNINTRECSNAKKLRPKVPLGFCKRGRSLRLRCC